jgi:hypothetical protein
MGHAMRERSGRGALRSRLAGKAGPAEVDADSYVSSGWRRVAGERSSQLYLVHALPQRSSSMTLAIYATFRLGPDEKSNTEKPLGPF